MVLPLSSRSPKRFDAAEATRYDRLIRARVPGYDALHQASVAMLSATLPAAADLLVVGAGTGAELVSLANAGPHWSITAVEPSSEMAWETDKRLAAHKLSSRVNLSVSTIEAFTSERGYDGAIALLVSHFSPDDGRRARFLESIAAQLKPGAALVLVDLAPPPNDPVAAAAIRGAWFDRAAAGGLSMGQLMKMTHRVQDAFHPISTERLSALLTPLDFSTPTRFCQLHEFVGHIAFKRAVCIG